MSRPLKNLEWLGQRDEAEHVPCEREGCEAAPGEHCRNVQTGDELRAPAHWQRVKTAEETP